jgi:hypothetical protein
MAAFPFAIPLKAFRETFRKAFLTLRSARRVSKGEERRYPGCCVKASVSGPSFETALRASSG